MLGRYLITALAAFAVGFIAGWWVLEGRCALDVAVRDAGDANAHVKAYQRNNALAGAISEIDAKHLKELQDVNAENDRLRRLLAAGAASLHVAATCPRVSAPAAGSRVADGAGARLNPGAESDYFAIREGIQRCRAKVTGLQGIIREERRGGVH